MPDERCKKNQALSARTIDCPQNYPQGPGDHFPGSFKDLMRLVDGMTKDASSETSAWPPERVHCVTWHVARPPGVHHLATPNYSYEKRQRELAKKRRAEEKRLRKTNKSGEAGDHEPASDSADAPDSQTSLEQSPATPESSLPK